MMTRRKLHKVFAPVATMAGLAALILPDAIPEPRSRLWKLGKYLTYLFIIGSLLLGSPTQSATFEIFTHPQQGPNGFRWPKDKMPVVYYINENGSDDITDGFDFEAIHKAFKTWEDVPSSYITFKYGGTTTENRPIRRDGQNTILWVESGWPKKLGAQVQSAAEIWSFDGIMKECDIIFNGEHARWSTKVPPPSRHTYDIQAIATHEIGHLLGLVESSFGSALDIKSPRTHAARRVLNDDDIAGVTFLYPRHVLKGVVRDALSGSPLSDVSIEKVDIHYTVKTDQEGCYEYGMPSGIAHILAYCDGYVPSLKTLEVTEDSVTVYDISLSPIPPEGPITSVEDVLSSGIPGEYLLAQNFPNPFNTFTRMSYQLPKAGHIEIAVYSITGHLVRTLVNEYKDPGFYTLTWDGKDNSGEEVSSGVYLYRMQASDFTAAKRMLILR